MSSVSEGIGLSKPTYTIGGHVLAQDHEHDAFRCACGVTYDPTKVDQEQFTAPHGVNPEGRCPDFPVPPERDTGKPTQLSFL